MDIDFSGDIGEGLRLEEEFIAVSNTPWAEGPANFLFPHARRARPVMELRWRRGAAALGTPGWILEIRRAFGPSAC